MKQTGDKEKKKVHLSRRDFMPNRQTQRMTKRTKYELGCKKLTFKRFITARVR